MNNENWKRLCNGELQAKQLEINLKEVDRKMTKEDEGKEVVVTLVDAVDECRAIQVGDSGELVEYDEARIPCILFKTGLAKGSIYCMNEDQLKVVRS